MATAALSFAPADSFVRDGRVDNRIADRAMAHKSLKRPCIDSTGRQSVSGSMPQHVGMDREKAAQRTRQAVL